MYEKPGYIVYRRVLKYYSGVDSPDEDAFGMFTNNKNRDNVDNDDINFSFLFFRGIHSTRYVEST
jgi:hypothetical protein